jgi:hypothetical protein
MSEMSEYDRLIKLAQICNEEDYEPFHFTDPPKGWGSWLLEEVIPEEVIEQPEYPEPE